MAQAPPAPKAELLGDSYRALSSSPPPRLSPKAPTTTLVNKLLVCKTGGASSNNIGQRMRTLLPPPPPFHVKEMRSIPKTKSSQAPTLAPDTRFDGQLQTQSSTSIGFQGGHEHTMIRPSSCMSSHEIGSPGKGVKAEEDIGDFKKKHSKIEVGDSELPRRSGRQSTPRAIKSAPPRPSTEPDSAPPKVLDPSVLPHCTDTYAQQRQTSPHEEGVGSQRDIKAV